MSIVCRICGTEIPVDQDLCPNCGRLKVNFPVIIPDKLKKLFEEEKVRYEQDVKDGDEKESSRSAAVKDLEMQVAQQSQLLEDVRNELKEANQKLEIAKNDHEELLQTETNKLFNELKLEKEKLAAEIVNHNKTKERLQEEEEKVKELQQQLNNKTLQHSGAGLGRGVFPTPIPVGHIEYDVNGKMFKKPIYSGDNFFSSQDIDCGITGNLFKVVHENEDIYIYDMCGQMRNAYGKGIGTNGKRIYSGDVVVVGNMKIRFDIQDYDLENLLL